MFIDNASTTQLNLYVKSGDVHVKNVIAFNIEAMLNKGDVSIQDSKMYALTTYLSRGGVILGELVSKQINLVLEKGDIVGTIAEEEKNFKIKIDATSGDVNLKFTK